MGAPSGRVAGLKLDAGREIEDCGVVDAIGRESRRIFRIAPSRDRERKRNAVLAEHDVGRTAFARR